MSAPDRAPEFANPDGSPASWVERVPQAKRRAALVWRAGIGLVLALAAWALQLKNGEFHLEQTWVGFIPLVIGALFGFGAYRGREKRRYSVLRVEHSTFARLARAGKWWGTGLLLLAIIWTTQWTNGHLAEYWWYAWPLLIFVAIGVRYFFMYRETTLTTEAAKAKMHYESDAIRFAGRERKDTALTGFDTFFAQTWVRYLIAVACLYGAYHLTFVESSAKSSGLGALCFVVIAAFCAREAALWLLGIGLVVAVGWALYAGIAALPVSAAVIIGALIIASAISRR